MSPRKPLIAALAMAAMFLLWMADRNMVRNSAITDVRDARLIYFDAVDATRVELENVHGRFVLEKRDGDVWWLVEPVEVPADRVQVGAMIDNLMGAKKVERFAAKDLAPYGLDDPSPVITVFGNVAGEAVEETIMLGGDANRPGRIYGMTEGEDRVFAVGDWVRSHTLRDLDLLRDRRILRFDPDGVASFTVGTPDGSTTLVRSDRFAVPWEIQELGAPADTRFVERVLATLSEAPATTIDDEPTSSTAALGLERPRLTVELDANEGARALSLGKREGDEWFARSSTQPGVLTIRTRYVADLLQPPKAWVTGRFVWHAPKNWRRIRTAAGNTETNLVRDEEGGEWYFEESPDLRIDPRKLSAFIDAISELRAGSAGGLAGAGEREAGVRDGTFRIEIEMADGATEGFAAGKLDTTEGVQWLLRLQDGFAGTIRAEDFHRVFVFRKDLQDRRVAEPFAERVRRVELTYFDSLGTNLVYNVVNESGVWKVRLADGRVRVPPGQAVETFLRASEDLEWEDPAVLQDQKPVGVLRYFGEDDTEIVVIRVFADKDGVPFMQVGKVVFYPVADAFRNFNLSTRTLALSEAPEE